MATEADFHSALKQAQDPELQRSIIDLGMVRDMKASESMNLSGHKR